MLITGCSVLIASATHEVYLLVMAVPSEIHIGGAILNLDFWPPRLFTRSRVVL